mmetsp:Transcript_8647/g.34021  ORF Transcript_8647/g.34021 Transcript_8647/m.34021 type:complete len:209 (-) Transcript_8647:420-1046(-)
MLVTSRRVDRSKFPATSRLRSDFRASNPFVDRSLLPRSESDASAAPFAWSERGSRRALPSRLNPRSRRVSRESPCVPLGSIARNPFLRRSSDVNSGQHAPTLASVSPPSSSPPTYARDRSFGHVAAGGLSCADVALSPSATKIIASVPTHPRRWSSSRCARTSLRPRTRLPSHIGRRVAAARSQPRSSSRASDAKGARLSSESAEGSC